MANDEHLKVLEQGVKIWNQWREDNPNIMPDFRGADLADADLRKAHLQRANLKRANLFRADLSRTILTAADLSKSNLRRITAWGAYLYEANLVDADIGGSDLTGANLGRTIMRRSKLVNSKLSVSDLSNSDLSEADLTNADISNVNLSGAILAGTNFRDCTTFGGTLFTAIDLKKVKRLETVKHFGPSTIGIDTIYRSQGKIPEVFLRKAGVPENFIKYMHHLIGNANQFHSCFISYSAKDQDFAERLHSDLQDKGVRCWFAPEDIKGGRKLHEQIPEAIRLYDKLLLVLSKNSINSEWVKTEIYHARQDEILTGKRKLFPIGLIGFEEIRKWEAFDADAGKDMAREIRECFIPDFSDWKNHDSYKKAFDRLLRDLQAED